MPNAIVKIWMFSCLFIFSAVSSADVTEHLVPQSEPTPFADSPVLLNAQTYGVPEGLSQSTVTSIVEDNDGYIWIGTLNGLNRFDGKEFKQYFANDGSSGLPSSFIKSLLFSKGGLLIVGTDKGVVIFNEISDKFIAPQITNKALLNEIWSLSESENSLLIGTNKSVIETSQDFTAILNSHVSEKSIEPKKIVKIQNQLFIKGYDKSVYAVNNSDFIKIANNINDITAFENELYLTSNLGLYILRKEDFSLKKINNKKLSLLSVESNNLYSLHDNYIEINSTNTSVGKIVNLDKSIEKSFFLARPNYFFIGIENHGFKVVSKSNNLVKSTSVQSGNIWSINRTNDGVLISSDDSIIKIYDKNLSEKRSYDTGLRGNKNSIELGNTLYIGTHKGLYSLDLESISKNVELLLEDNITAVASNTASDVLALGTSIGELLILRDNKLVHRINTDPKYPVLDLLYSEDNTIYIATQGGLYSFQNEKLNKLTSLFTYSVEEQGNNIIFGTNTGLYKLSKKEGEVKEIYSNNKEVYSIAISGNQVIAASIGEVILTDSEKTYILSTEHGSQYEYNTQSASFVSDDKVVLGGINGLSVISTFEFKNYIHSLTSKNTEITSLLVFNIKTNDNKGFYEGPINNASQVNLKYSDYPFTFQFNSPMSTADNNNYFYRMSGLSEDWITSNGVNSATYTNLSPGLYEFQVYAVEELSKKNGPIKKIKVRITPPWWLSTQAKLVYCLVFLVISIVIIKAILRRRETHRQIAKSEERLKLSLW